MPSNKSLIKMWYIKSTKNDTNKPKYDYQRNLQPIKFRMFTTLQFRRFPLLICHQKMKRLNYSKLQFRLLFCTSV